MKMMKMKTRSKTRKSGANEESVSADKNAKKKLNWMKKIWT